MTHSLEHFDFETLRSAFSAKMNFAYASRAGGGASRSRRLRWMVGGFLARTALLAVVTAFLK
jgi:hypothetical protein